MNETINQSTITQERSNMEVFSLHKIFNRDKIPFSEIEYSKFKFGEKSIAKKYGFELAHRLIYSGILNQSEFSNDKIVVCSSPYCFIPTATYAMKDYFIQILNNHLVAIGRSVVEETKIHRTITYKEDYGALTAQQRLNLIEKDEFHIDKEFIKGKTIIFLDDIKITGSHEKVICRMADKYGLENNMIFAYYAQLCNPEIHPDIENQLNYAFVKNLLDLDKIIKNDTFLLNTRVVKFILNSDPNEFNTFIQYQSIKLVQNIYHQAIGNGYHLIDDYKSNLDYISSLLHSDL